MNMNTTYPRENNDIIQMATMPETITETQESIAFNNMDIPSFTSDGSGDSYAWLIQDLSEAMEIYIPVQTCNWNSTNTISQLETLRANNFHELRRAGQTPYFTHPVVTTSEVIENVMDPAHETSLVVYTKPGQVVDHFAFLKNSFATPKWEAACELVDDRRESRRGVRAGRITKESRRKMTFECLPLSGSMKEILLIWASNVLMGKSIGPDTINVFNSRCKHLPKLEEHTPISKAEWRSTAVDEPGGRTSEEQREDLAERIWNREDDFRGTNVSYHVSERTAHRVFTLNSLQLAALPGLLLEARLKDFDPMIGLLSDVVFDPETRRNVIQRHHIQKRNIDTESSWVFGRIATSLYYGAAKRWNYITGTKPVVPPAPLD